MTARAWQDAASLAVRLKHRVSILKHEWLKLPVARNLRCLSLRRTSAVYPGRAVGIQVVRYYWNRFLEERQQDIRGRALEIGVTGTIRHFGRPPHLGRSHRCGAFGSQRHDRGGSDEGRSCAVRPVRLFCQSVHHSYHLRIPCGPLP